MAIAETRVHIICGFCGRNDMFKLKIDRSLYEHVEVGLLCENCGSLTDLAEVITEDTQHE